MHMVIVANGYVGIGMEKIVPILVFMRATLWVVLIIGDIGIGQLRIPVIIR